MSGHHSNDLTILPKLAEQINAEHALAEAALREGLLHARAAGNLLVQAKSQLKHGQWLPWLKANVRFSERTAQAYMQVAKRWSELESKAQSLADLTFEGGLHLLAAPKENEPTPEPAPKAQALADLPFQDAASADKIQDEYHRRREQITADRDQKMAWLFVLSGWPAQRIATYVRKSLAWVERYLRFARFLAFVSCGDDEGARSDALHVSEPLDTADQKTVEQFNTQLREIREEYTRKRSQIDVEAGLAMERVGAEVGDEVGADPGADG
jgi:hypothetical protein